MHSENSPPPSVPAEVQKSGPPTRDHVVAICAIHTPLPTVQNAFSGSS